MALINASEASGLVDRHERVIRGWILTEQLKAEKAPSGRWSIDTANLKKVKHLTQEQRDRIEQFERGDLALAQEPVSED